MAEHLFSQLLSREVARAKNPLSLAFLGDTVWELLTRQRLLLSAARVNSLHKQAVSTVNAGAQAIACALIEPALNPEETDVLRRGQNAHSRHNAPKNQDPVSYSRATGLEAVFGYLYLTGQSERISELFDIGVPIL